MRENTQTHPQSHPANTCASVCRSSTSRDDPTRPPAIMIAVSHIIALTLARPDLGMLHAPLWLLSFFCGAAVAVFVAMLINLRWKISAHAIGIGGMAGMMLWLTAAGLASVNAMIWLTAIIIAGGLVGSAHG